MPFPNLLANPCPPLPPWQERGRVVAPQPRVHQRGVLPGARMCVCVVHAHLQTCSPWLRPCYSPPGAAPLAAHTPFTPCALPPPAPPPAQAYADYTEMMDLTEGVIRACAEAVCGTTQVGAGICQLQGLGLKSTTAVPPPVSDGHAQLGRASLALGPHLHNSLLAAPSPALRPPPAPQVPYQGLTINQCSPHSPTHHPQPRCPTRA